MLPHSQNVLRGVEIAVEDQPAAGADVDAVSKGELLPMATGRAILTRVRRIHRHESPTGPCCLVGEGSGKLRPRRVSDALGEAMVVQHPVDCEVFDGDQIKGSDDATAVLVGEIAPS